MHKPTQRNNRKPFLGVSCCFFLYWLVRLVITVLHLQKNVDIPVEDEVEFEVSTRDSIDGDDVDASILMTTIW